MEVTLFLARLFSLYFIVMAFGLLFNAKQFMAMAKSFYKNDGLILLTGVVTLLLGCAMVIGHNVWFRPLEVLVSVLAWLTFFKGVSFIVFPKWAKSVGKSFLGNEELLVMLSPVILFFGVVLGYLGFLA